MGRAPCCSKVGLHRGPWTNREDTLLAKFIEANGEGQWRALPKKAGLLRCGKSCRLRWMNYLRPDIKRGNIAHDEEELIIRLHRLLGNRWSLIAGRLPGRTDNEVKNYWNTHLSKKLAKKGIDPKTHKPLRSKADAQKPLDQLKNEEYPVRKKKDRDCKNLNSGTNKGYVQPIHLPKANRFIAFPRSCSNPDLPNIGIGKVSEVPRCASNPDLPTINGFSNAKDALLSPSIDLNSPISSFNGVQDSDYSSYLSPENELDTQSILQQHVHNNPQDCFPWPCIDENEEWDVSKFQPTEEVNVIPNSSSLQLHDDDDKCIISSQTKLSYSNIEKPENCSNVLLQKVYDEYLELLQEDPSPGSNNSGDLIPNNNGEDGIHVLSEGLLSSMWDCLQGDEELQKDEHNES